MFGIENHFLSGKSRSCPNLDIKNRFNISNRITRLIIIKPNKLKTKIDAIEDFGNSTGAINVYEILFRYLLVNKKGGWYKGVVSC